ncbi:MAG: nuclear transport factor 2 family protein [Candidatus Acidiferrum sp.]
METKEPVSVVLAFLEAINSGDANQVCALVSEDHVFVDALGNKVEGRESMRKAWAGYFQWFPDYRVSHEAILSDGNLVAAFGNAQGTYASKGVLAKQNHWNTPAAWKAVIRDGLVKEWRVYADNQAARKIMGWPNP